MTGGRKEFQKELLQIAIPVILQCLMQSSFSVVDQIMTGQLGRHWVRRKVCVHLFGCNCCRSICGRHYDSTIYREERHKRGRTKLLHKFNSIFDTGILVGVIFPILLLAGIYLCRLRYKKCN